MVVAALLAVQALVPVHMEPVQLGPATAITGGSTQEISVGDQSATVFVPDGWKPAASNRVALHFHSAAWFVVSQYQQTGLNAPVVTFNFGQGSSVYGAPFKVKGSFTPWLAKVEAAIRIHV